MAKDKTVAFQLVDALQELGVKYVFGVPSGGWVDYMEALRTSEGMEFILTTHEGAAAMMADVCGRLDGAPGVCFGTLGPGATNLATGVGGALLDRSPMIALTDEIPANLRGRTTQMGIDHQALFASLTKKTTRLDVEFVRSQVFDAAHLALKERPGPVHMGLPLGLSGETAGTERLDFVPPPPAPAADPAQLEKAARLFVDARRPLLAVGLGAVHARVDAEIQALARKHNIPVVLTPMAKGLLTEDSPSYAGVLFHALSDMVGETHQQADLVIGVGYDPVEFNYELWLPDDAPLVSLDIAPADINCDTCTLAVDAVGNIGISLNMLLDLPPTRNDWDLDAMGQRRAAMFAKLGPSKQGFGPKGALAVLREVLPDDGIMTCDVGAHTHLIGQLWPTPALGLQIMSNGWSSMGFGIPSAIAAKLMCPDKIVCTVVGDGGFLMTAGEIATAIRYNINIVIVLLADNELALIRIKQENKGNPIYGTPVREGGTIRGDNIFGAPVFSTHDEAAFRVALEAAFTTEGPVIVEAVIDSREYDELVLKKDKP